MTDKEILRKAVIKAQQKDYRLPSAGIAWDLMEGSDLKIDPTIISYIIFSHDFAKAIWGEKAKQEQIMRYCDMIINDENIIRWKYYLKKMVLEKEPLKYLEKFITVEVS